MGVHPFFIPASPLVSVAKQSENRRRPALVDSLGMAAQPAHEGSNKLNSTLFDTFQNPWLRFFKRASHAAPQNKTTHHATLFDTFGKRGFVLSSHWKSTHFDTFRRPPALLASFSIPPTQTAPNETTRHSTLCGTFVKPGFVLSSHWEIDTFRHFRLPPRYWLRYFKSCWSKSIDSRNTLYSLNRIPRYASLEATAL